MDFVNLARFARKQKRQTFFTSGISHRWDQRKDRSELCPVPKRGEEVQNTVGQYRSRLKAQVVQVFSDSAMRTVRIASFA